MLSAGQSFRKTGAVWAGVRETGFAPAARPEPKQFGRDHGKMPESAKRVDLAGLLEYIPPPRHREGVPHLPPAKRCTSCPRSCPGFEFASRQSYGKPELKAAFLGSTAGNGAP